MGDLKDMKYHESTSFNHTHSRRASDRVGPGDEMSAVCSDGFSSKRPLCSVGTYSTDGRSTTSSYNREKVIYSRSEQLRLKEEGEEKEDEDEEEEEQKSDIGSRGRKRTPKRRFSELI